MKPDGTYSVSEILQICNDQLQSWERDKICVELLKDCSGNQLSEFFSRYTPEYISTITGYYVSEDEPEEFDIDKDLSTCDLIDALEGRLSYVPITQKQKKLLKTMAETAETLD